MKGTIHWVSKAHAVNSTANLYEPLTIPDEQAESGYVLNPRSLTVAEAVIEPAVRDYAESLWFQFIRNGYFYRDKEAEGGRDKYVFNRTVSLKSSFKPSN